MQLRRGVGFPSSCRELVLYRRPVTWHDANGFYRILGVTPAASDDEIRHVGRSLLARYHPDGPEPDQDKFLAVEEAYRSLRDNREIYDQVPDGHVMVTDNNRHDSRLIHMEGPPKQYDGWSYFSEVPRATDDAIAVWAYETFLEEVLRQQTTLPRIAVALIQGIGDPWVDDGLIYVPVSEIEGRVATTPETARGPKDKADNGHVTSQ